MPLSMSVPTPSYRQVMIFTDGGYLREYLKKELRNDRISMNGFQNLVHYLVECVKWGTIHGELVRTYYYDAIAEETEKDTREGQKLFFGTLSHVPFCTIRLGRLIKTKEGYRQKGVDILMAIDMLTKAYENHYEIAILVAGDGDFVDLVEAVKDAGKRVYGAYVPRNISQELRESFDVPLALPGKILKSLIS